MQLEGETKIVSGRFDSLYTVKERDVAGRIRRMSVDDSFLVLIDRLLVDSTYVRHVFLVYITCFRLELSSRIKFVQKALSYNYVHTM